MMHKGEQGKRGGKFSLQIAKLLTPALRANKS